MFAPTLRFWDAAALKRGASGPPPVSGDMLLVQGATTDNLLLEAATTDDLLLQA